MRPEDLNKLEAFAHRGAPMESKKDRAEARRVMRAALASLSAPQAGVTDAAEIIRDLLADLTSPFPMEAVAVASLRMGDTSIERALAYLAANVSGQDEQGGAND